VYVLELAGMDDDFAAYEAECGASAVESLAPGLVRARGLTDRFRGLAYTHRASELVGTCDPAVSEARLVLEAATVDREGSAAVRARDVRGLTGVDTQRVERELGSVLAERGFDIELETPDHELRVLFSDGVCAVGWLAAEVGRGFDARAPPERPFVQPGSMDPMLARALANVAGARPGARLLDPMCGTGGILVEAGLVGADVVGLDAQSKMAAGTSRNLDAYLDGGWTVTRGDAARLPFAEGSFDAVVFDAPYGRQSKVRGDLGTLVGDALTEAGRVADRCVVVGDRPWARPAGRAGWQTEAAFTRRVHRSLTRYIVVLRHRESDS
jgi:tRNA (guanine10-N2)-dimethyltransferase